MKNQLTFVFITVLITVLNPVYAPAVQPANESRDAVQTQNDADENLLQAAAKFDEAFAVFTAKYADMLNGSALAAYKNLPQKDGSNTIFSPLSLYQALGIVLYGAAGTTQKQIADFLALPGLDNPAFSYYADCLAGLYNNASFIETTNTVWLLDESISLQKDFSLDVDQLGRDIIQTLPAGAVPLDVINGWFKTKTRGRINALFDKIDPSAKLLVANAVFFKARWFEPFDKKLTKDKTFYPLTGKEHSTAMMSLVSDFAYYKGKDFAAVVIPYEYTDDSAMSMTVLLADKGADFKEFCKKLDTAVLSEIFEKNDFRAVALTLPRFETESDVDLIPVLQSAGITSAFDISQADFSGITGGKDLFIGQAKQKANITVDEEGTIAAAATGVGMLMKSAPPEEEKPPVEFIADRPFIYLVRDNKTGLIVFIGHVEKL